MNMVTFFLVQFDAIEFSPIRKTCQWENTAKKQEYVLQAGTKAAGCATIKKKANEVLYELLL